MESPGVYTKQGVLISVTGIAQVKFQVQSDEMLRNACEQFLGKTEEEIRRVALETLEGHQRAIIGSMTVEVKKMYTHKFKAKNSITQVMIITNTPKIQTE